MRYVKPLSLFQDLLKTDALERGSLLGLDVGSKYIGLAVSDINNKIASPLRYLKSFILKRVLTNHFKFLKFWDVHLV